MLTQHYSRDFCGMTGEGLVHRWGRFMRRGMEFLRHYPQLARQRRQLLELDERQLRDIGLTRSEAVNMAGRWFL